MPGPPDLTYSQGGGAVPFRVRLAPGQDIELESVTAQWDGTGASGAFLPCLAMYSQDGVLLSRTFPQGVALAAGDTAEVTYAPFLGGGDATATAREQFSGGQTTIANGAGAKLSWTHLLGNTLLDTTLPTQPAALLSARYAITATVIPNDLGTAGGCYVVTLTMDEQDQSAQAIVTSPPSDAANSKYVSVSLTYYVPAGNYVSVHVQNLDGAVARDFGIYLSDVQQL